MDNLARDFIGNGDSEQRASYYRLYRGIDLIDVALENSHNVPYLYQRINIMSRVWRAGRKEGVDIIRDLKNARYEIDRWIEHIEHLDG